MLWLTWRQHRAEALAALLLFVLLAVPIVVGGLAMHDAYRIDGVAACVADSAGAGCSDLVARFVDRHQEWANRLLWAAFLPALTGAFVGAPLLAREFEQGTWRFAFTQTVPRARWLAVKLALVGGSVAVLTAAFAALIGWWRMPLDEISGRMHAPAFLVAVPGLTAAAVFTFAVGVLAGALLQRTVVAMGATLLVFLAVRLPLEEYVRPHYRTPLVRVAEPSTQPAAWRPDRNWTVHSGWVDTTGHRLTDAEEDALLRQVDGGVDAVYGSGVRTERFMLDHGLRHYIEYHPDGRFALFQAIESALFLVPAAVVLVAAVLVVRRRA